jgi:hypothetical protein
LCGAQAAVEQRRELYLTTRKLLLHPTQRTSTLKFLHFSSEDSLQASTSKKEKSFFTQKKKLQNFLSQPEYSCCTQPKEQGTLKFFHFSFIASKQASKQE